MTQPVPSGLEDLPKGTLIQMPQNKARLLAERIFKSASPAKTLFDHFTALDFRFFLERVRVFTYLGEDGNKLVPSVIGILPSFVPSTAADPMHEALSISFHISGSAVAVSVNVSHKPFGVTQFSLYEVQGGKIVSSSLPLKTVNKLPAKQLASSLHAPVVSKRPKDFPAMTVPDQGLLVSSVVRQLLQENFSKQFFPPEYATAITAQTPSFQKFGLAINERFRGTVLGITASTSSSTSSNICTSTSTSTIEI
jgi:hypothetical protein